MRAARETFSLRSLKVRLALAGAVLILASVALTVIFVLREVGRSSEQIVLDSQEDDARRIAATISQRLVGLQRALRSVALQLTPATLGDRAQAHRVRPEPGRPVDALLERLRRLARRQDRRRQRRERRARPASQRRRPRLLQGHGARAPADDRPRRDVARLGRADRDPDDAGVRGRRPGRRGARRIAAPVEPLAARRPDPGSRTDRPARSRPSSSTPRARSCRIRRANGCFATASSEPAIAAALQDWRQRGSPIEPAGYALRAGDHEVGLAGVPDADWLVLRSGRADVLLGGVLEGEKRARWLAFGVAAGRRRC